MCTDTYDDDPMIGRVFGDLIVLKRIPSERMPNGKKEVTYLVQCTCGAKFKATGYNLRKGRRTQCAYCSGDWERPTGF